LKGARLLLTGVDPKTLYTKLLGDFGLCMPHPQPSHFISPRRKIFPALEFPPALDFSLLHVNSTCACEVIAGLGLDSIQR